MGPGVRRWAVGLLLIFLASVPAVSFAQAIAARVVQGTVQDADSSKPIANAVVYLQDQKSMGVRTFITGPDGSYRFGQLSSDVDYQLWAELKGHKSKTRSISSFDSKKQFQFELKIDMSK
jgi:hypothetical protein